MAKIKVLDLAREVGMEDDKLLLKLKRMGVKVKDQKSTEPEKTSLPDEKVIESDSGKEIVEKRLNPTVIRRRTRSPGLKIEPLQTSPIIFEPIAEEVSIPKLEEEKPKLGVEIKKEATKKKDSILPTKVTKRRGKADEIIEPEITPVIGVEAKAEIKETIPAKHIEEVIQPHAAQVTKKGDEKQFEVRKPKEETIPKEVVSKKADLKVPIEEESDGKGEKVPFPVKKKGFGKKKRIIEERMLVVDELEGEVQTKKETEFIARPFRPMKKKVVLKSPKKTVVTVPKPIKRIIRIAEVIAVGDLAKRMGVKGGDLIKRLLDIGVFANINQVIDADIASLVASEFGYEVEKVLLERQDLLERKEDLPEQLKPRPPVVTIMGHVDHGKTMLLDAIRKTNVVEGEAGGITQHIGAYDVQLENGHVVFIDTPGHEAFTALRARGAQVTDVVVLVVAADDGVMPQTKEAIDHARAANVPIVVAINKIDKTNANPEKVKKELMDYNLAPEKWGGNTLFAEVSAKQKKGIKELLELILLQAEVLELRANPDKPARGVIIEAKLDKGRGPLATLLVQEGTLKTGEVLIAGSQYGRLRAMLNDKGQKIEEARPSTPVEVLGFTDVPEAGETFIVISEERMAKQISLYRQEKIREKELSKLSKVSLEELYQQIKKGEMKELNVIIKADVQGSIEAVKEAFKKVSTDTVKVNILHDGVGGITETDVNLALASNAIIIGFNVRPGQKAQVLAEQERVDIRTYSVIYDAIDDIKKALEGLLEPTYKEHILGRAEVIAVFNIHKMGQIAGSLVTNGKMIRGAHARLLRDNVVIYHGRISSLKRFKDDTKDCSQGLECGIKIESFNDVKLGDIIESYELEEIQTRLT